MARESEWARERVEKDLILHSRRRRIRSLIDHVVTLEEQLEATTQGESNSEAGSAHTSAEDRGKPTEFVRVDGEIEEVLEIAGVSISDIERQQVHVEIVGDESAISLGDGTAGVVGVKKKVKKEPNECDRESSSFGCADCRRGRWTN